MVPRTLWLLLGVAVFSPARAEAAKEPVYVVVRPANLTQALVWNGTEYVAELGVGLAPGVKLPQLRQEPAVMAVHPEDAPASALESDFTASLIETANAPLALRITMKEIDRPPGSYSVTLKIAKKTDGPSAPGQYLEFRMTRPAPTVALPEKIYLEQGDGVHTNGIFTITESSWKGLVSHPELRVENDPKSWAHAGSGVCLQLTSPDAPVLPPDADPCDVPVFEPLQPGKHWTLQATTVGHLRAGTYTGKVVLRSPALGAPASINFEIVSRIWRGWILFIVLGGSLLGLMVRVGFKWLQDKNNSRIQASLAVGQLKAAQAAVQDPEFRTAIDALIQDVQQAATYGTAAALPDKAASVIQRLQTLQTKLEADIAALDTQRQALTSLVTARWKLPPDIQQTVEELKPQARRIEQYLAAKNPTTARQALSDLVNGPLYQTVQASRRWRGLLAEYYRHIARAGPAMPNAVRDQLSALSKKIDPSDLPAVVIPLTVTAADEQLVEADGAYQTWESTLSEVNRAIERFRERVQLELPDSDWSLVETAEKSIVDNFMESRDHLEAANSSLDPVIDAQRETWRDLLVQAKFPPADLGKAIAQNNWDGILDLLPSSPHPEVLGYTRQFIVNPDRIHADSLVLPERVEPERIEPAALDSPDLPDPIQGTEAERRRLRWGAWRAAAFQTLAVTVVFLGCAVALNWDSWIGAPKDLATLFLLAFGADLTAEGIRGALKV